MTSEEQIFIQNPFIQHLLSLSPERDRQELAILRRGLGMPPGQDIRMYPYVISYLPEDVRGTDGEKLYYLIAALFAYHSLNTSDGNFGNHMAQAVVGQDDKAAVERRFTILLNAHIEDLPNYLRQAVSFLKSKEIPVNWLQLFKDLKLWDHPERMIQRRWANAFWGDLNKSTQSNQTDSK